MDFKRKLRLFFNRKKIVFGICMMLLTLFLIQKLTYFCQIASRQIETISNQIEPAVRQLHLERSIKVQHTYVHQTVPDNRTFIEVRGTKIFMYSAYYDSRDKEKGPMIRVLALAPRRELRQVNCVYETGSGTRVCCGQAERVEINSRLLDMPYPTSIAVFYLCRCKNLPLGPPAVRVTLLPQSCSFLADIDRFVKPGGSELWVRVASPVDRSSSPYSDQEQFTVCIPPVFALNRLTPLLRTLESNLFFGAGRVVVYNHSLPGGTGRLLQSYLSEGRVELVAWPLSRTGLVGQHQVHYHGQNLAINDCLYRHQGASQYLVYSDLDELVVPRAHDTWRQLMATLEDAHPGAGSFLFRHVLFDYNATHEPQLYYFDEWRRSAWVLPWRIRSKVVVVPERVVSVGVHETFGLVEGYRQVVVPRHLGLLHHYNRNVPLRGPYLNDTRMQAFRDRFRLQLEKRLALLDGVNLTGNSQD